MKEKTITKEMVIRWITFSVCLLFCLFTYFFFSIKNESGKAIMALLSVLYICIPFIAEKLFRFKIQIALYIFIMLYAICPLLGYSYKLYYLISWWDSLLHGFAGVVFAMFGAYLPKVFEKGKCSIAVCAMCGFFFSVALAGLWEFVEFGMDTSFGTDMQKDIFVDKFHSYLIGPETGVLGGYDKITSVIVNGETLPGYVDIGLFDTMKDMLVETAGALFYTIIFVAGKGKYFVFELLPPEKTQEATSQAVAAKQEEDTETPAS